MISIGKIGDFYINTTNQTIFGPKQAQSWGTAVSLKSDERNGVILYYVSTLFDKEVTYRETTNIGIHPGKIYYISGKSKEYTIPNGKKRLNQFAYQVYSRYTGSSSVYAQGWKDFNSLFRVSSFSINLSHAYSGVN